MVYHSHLLYYLCLIWCSHQQLGPPSEGCLRIRPSISKLLLVLQLSEPHKEKFYEKSMFSFVPLKFHFFRLFVGEPTLVAIVVADTLSS